MPVVALGGSCSPFSPTPREPMQAGQREVGNFSLDVKWRGFVFLRLPVGLFGFSLYILPSQLLLAYTFLE